MNTDPNDPLYHVLLIGIDSYPPGYNSLQGCVNDIDTIEKLLLDPPGIGIPVEQFRVTRLAAPLSGASSASRFAAQTQWPTKENVVAALRGLAGADVKKSDRVLIYYSGHGDERQWTGSSVWHEALVPNDGQQVENLFDVEVNTLINAIADRTDDLTIVLDCCHAAGTTRDLDGIQPAGSVRFLQHKKAQVEPPDMEMFGVLPGVGDEKAMTSGMLQSSSAPYLAVVACQSDERAGEGAFPAEQPSFGVLTHGLWSVLRDKNANERAQLRWADIWPTLLAETAGRNEQLRQRIQHPWIIGRSERRVFGGAWEKMDAGYQVIQRQAGDYEIGAGRLMGVTEGAEVAVYGAEPRYFPRIGSTEDQPIGRLRVTESGPSSAIASPMDAAFALPAHPRGRLIRPGESARLRVSLKPEHAALQAQLEKSPLLEVVASTESNADVEVRALSGGGWVIGSDVEPAMATVPAEEVVALRAGLEHYYRYNTLLRLARNCNDPRVSKCLSIRLLDCNDTAALQAMSPEEKADPDLPEAPRDNEGNYILPPGFKFCIKVANCSPHHLQVTLFNASAGGLVEYLSDALLRDGAAHVMWRDDRLGAVFTAVPDALPESVPDMNLPEHSTERVIAVGTTRCDVDLRYLVVHPSVQEVVNTCLSTQRGGERSLRPEKAAEAPAEMWTATVKPIRIQRG